MKRYLSNVMPIFLTSLALLIGFTYDLPLLVGLSMLGVGATFAKAFWSASAPVDPEQPIYDRFAKPEGSNKKLIPSGSTEGLGVVFLLLLFSGVLTWGFINEAGVLTVLSMFGVGIAFTLGLWKKNRNRSQA